MKAVKRKYPRGWYSRKKELRARPLAGRCECKGWCRYHVGRRCREYRGEEAQYTKGKKPVRLQRAHLCHNSLCRNKDHIAYCCPKCHGSIDGQQHAHNGRLTQHLKQTGQLPLFGFEQLARAPDELGPCVFDPAPVK